MSDYSSYPMTGDSKKEKEVWKRVVDEMQRSDVITNVVTKAIRTAVTEVASPKKGKDSGVRRKKRSCKRKSKRSGKKSKRSDGKKKKSKGCFMSYHSRYQGRPGPPFPAQDCKNFKKRGNDLYMYKSKRNKNGVYHWVKLN